MSPRIATLPRNVREVFLGLEDEDVRNDPAVLDATDKLRDLQALHSDHTTKMEEQRRTVDAAAAKLQEIERAIAAINAGRTELAARAVRGDAAADKLDRDAQARRADLVRQQSLLQIGVDGARFDLERRGLNPYGARCADAAYDRDEAIFAAKVALAEQRAG